MGLKLTGSALLSNIPSASINLADLHDCLIVAPQSGNYLRYNSAINEWENSYITNDMFAYLHTNFLGTQGISVTQNPVSHTISVGLGNTGVVGNTYSYPTLTVDAQGRITTISNNTPVTSIVAGAGITISSNTGAVTISSTATGGSIPGGLPTQLQYNNNGAFAGTPNITFDLPRNILLLKAANEYIHDLGNLSTSLSQDLDVTISNNFCCILASNTAFNFVGAQTITPLSRSMVQSITIYIQHSATSVSTPIWPTGIYWQDNMIPDSSIVPNSIDIYTFITYNGGTTWIGLQQAAGLISAI